MSADLGVASLRDQPPTLLIQLVTEGRAGRSRVKKQGGGSVHRHGGGGIFVEGNQQAAQR